MIVRGPTSLQLCSLPRWSVTLRRATAEPVLACQGVRQDPPSGREIRLRKTRRSEVEAQIELGKLRELARAGGQPDSDVTVAELLDEYNRGYIRRTIKPALGIREVRKIRGPLLDNLYTCLQRCGNLACVGMPFTEHRQR